MIWLILIAALSLGAAFFYKQNPLANAAQRYATSVATASAATYVTLRTLNAVLSTAQEVEVSGSALVVSGTAQPLRMLEPVDDTVERIASVVFNLMLATGILAVAMGPVGAVGGGMIAAASLLWIMDRLLGPRDVVSVLSRRLAWYGGFFLLALPLAFVMSAWLADWLTADVLARHQAIIAEITASVGAPVPEQAGGWWDTMRETLGEAGRYQDLAQNLWTRADDLVGSYVALLAVFVFKIFVLPALLAGALFILTRFFAHRPEGG
ncbi:hypothetical protein [Ruegeria sp. PrR005]|uniref:Uncharacterized protein n=1 Tax=Ruegeria sp. PrR005 TaxID=2706882 RepID=A0A6B2NV40_9RHOB|nr:hypothetical protein [Ruegeria sp. PrR005]NDW48091.1 hypothetical protein [Ruegeria sp. PrR005]